jgi:hypothetical protein
MLKIEVPQSITFDCLHYILQCILALHLQLHIDCTSRPDQAQQYQSHLHYIINYNPTCIILSTIIPPALYYQLYIDDSCIGVVKLVVLGW